MDPRFIEAGASRYLSAVAGELTAAVKATPGKLFYLRVCNTTASKVYVFVYNNTAASGTLLCAPIPVPANDQYVLFAYPIGFTTALTISSSTTQTAYVAGGANDIQVEAWYK